MELITYCRGRCRRMVMGNKHHLKAVDIRYQKVLDKHDPFDQLILELGSNGVLDVCVVGVGQKTAVPAKQEYSRKAVSSRGKHSSS
jgi:hypothetical protein